MSLIFVLPEIVVTCTYVHLRLLRKSKIITALKENHQLEAYLNGGLSEESLKRILLHKA
jgi:hypothetical protein